MTNTLKVGLHTTVTNPSVKCASPQRVCAAHFTSQKNSARASRPYLSDIVLQLVVLLDVEACPLHPLVEEQQILSVSSVRVNILLQVTGRHGRSTL